MANDRTGRGEYRPLVNVIGLWMLEGTMKDFASRPKTDAEWAKLIATAEKLPGVAALERSGNVACSSPRDRGTQAQLQPRAA